MELTLGDRYGFTALLGTRLETICNCQLWISLTDDNKRFELSVYPLDMYITGENSLVERVELGVASMINLVEWCYIDREKLNCEQCRTELKLAVESLAMMDKYEAGK